MSLIGDALKRREEDEHRPPPPTLRKKGPEEPSSTTPIISAPEEVRPEPAVQEGHRLSLRGRSPAASGDQPAPENEAAPVKASRVIHRRSKALLELIAIIVVVTLLLVGGVFVYLHLQEKKSADTSAPVAVTAMADTLPEQPSAPSPVRPFTETREALAVAADRAQDIDEASALNEDTSPPATPASPPDESAESPDQAQTTGAPESVPPTEIIKDETAATPATPPAPTASLDSAPAIMWPNFSLQAAIGSGKTGSVMIDGSIIKLGEKFGEVTVLEITPQGVSMEYMGQRRSFRVRR